MDNPLVLAEMLGASPKPVMLAPGAKEPSNSASKAIRRAGLVDSAWVFNDELRPNCAGPAATDDCVDATLEEVLHMVTDQGYGRAWPDVFSQDPSSSSVLTKAMDVARKDQI